jgi:hypothetical protein
MDSSAGEQLDAIARIARLFRERGIDHWLFRGVGVDFWVGRVTREHVDVDLAVRLPDRPSIHELLLGEGWHVAPVDDEAIGAGYRRDDVLLELTFVETDDDGRVLIPFADGSAVWSTVPFGEVTRELLGVRCRTIPLPVLRDGKSAARDDADDAVKDTADYEVLSRL